MIFSESPAFERTWLIVMPPRNHPITIPSPSIWMYPGATRNIKCCLLTRLVEKRETRELTASAEAELDTELYEPGGAIVILSTTFFSPATEAAFARTDVFSSAEPTTPLSVTLPLTDTIFTFCA